MSSESSPIERKRPAYARIADTLRDRIRSGGLPTGAILSEGALARLFGASRSPVKQAFAQLEAERLVRRFDGRGVVVGAESAPLLRLKITPDLLGLGPDLADTVRDDAWDALYYALERDVIHRSVFGRFRVNEVALARHFGVGRTVARNALLQAQAAGLLTKSDNAHWYVVPLDETRIRDLYELRITLEPPLLRSAAGAIPQPALDAMAARLHAVTRVFPDVTVAQLDELEADVHVRCLSYGRNVEMAEALKRTHCTLVVGKHIQAALAKRPQIDPFMDEHLAIIEALRAGAAADATDALLSHLTQTATKAADRLRAFRAQRTMAAVSYIVD